MTDRISIERSKWNALVAAIDGVTGSMEDIPENVPAATPAPAPTPVAEGGRPPLAWGAKVSQVFRDRVWWISDTLTAAQGQLFDANNLMACMAWESGETFSASVKNMAGSGATGLIQFMPTTAKDLGTTTAKLAAMTAEDQLNFVYKYFLAAIKARGAVVTLEDVYMTILWPAAVGKPNSYPLFIKASQPTAYRQNSGLDTDKDGTVTKFEAAAKVRDKLTKGLQFAA